MPSLLKKIRLFASFYRIRFKHFFFTKMLRINLTRERFLGFKIRCFKYATFALLFKDIFVRKSYYFKSESKAPFIIDCGSNIGMSILYFKMIYPNARIIAFEPDKHTFERLKENVEANKLTNVTLVNKALLDKPGTIKFYCDPVNHGSLRMSIREERVHKHFEEVETIPLSGFIDAPVDFLKMDIEGAEGQVIAELAEKKKLQMAKELSLEYHHHVKTDEDNLSVILKTLEDNGFGYQIKAHFLPHFKKKTFQDMAIFAYKK